MELDIRNLSRLVGSIFICQLPGIIGSIFTAPAIKTWYPTLQKPWFTPPDWVFAPVWITLYLLMGISLYLVWKEALKGKDIKKPIIFFTVQLLLNAAWSPIFFGLKNPLMGLLVIIALIIFIVPTIYYFYKLRKEAGLLLIPYVVWVAIATGLNYAILILN